MKPEFQTRRRIAVITCIVTLVFLCFYTRCSEPGTDPSQMTVTQMSHLEAQPLEKNDKVEADTKKKTARL